MKSLRLLFTIVVLCYYTTVFAQQKTVDSAQTSAIKSLEKRLDEQEEFKKRVSEEVSDQFKGELSKWLLIIGGAVTVLGYFGIKEFDKYLTRGIEKKIDMLTTEKFKEQFESLSERLDRLYKLFTLRLNLDEIRRSAEDKEKPKYPKIEETMALVDEAMQLGDDTFAAYVIDRLVPIHFAQSQYESLDKIWVRYSDRIKFSDSTYANIAIAYMGLYIETTVPRNKELCIVACDKANEVIYDYGVPVAVKLMIYMIDYDRSYVDEEKELEKTNAIKLLRRVSTGTLNVMAYETFNYIDISKDKPYSKKYVELLYKVAPDEMKELKAKYEAHLKASGITPPEADKQIDDANIESIVSSITKGQKPTLAQLDTLINSLLKLEDKAQILPALRNLAQLLYVNWHYDELYHLWKKNLPELNTDFQILYYFSAAFIGKYLKTKDKVFRKETWDTTERCLVALPDAGGPMAIRIALEAVDYKKTTSKKAKDDHLLKAKEIAAVINSSAAKETSQEAFGYIEDLNITYPEEKLVEVIWKMIPDEMEAMKKLATV
ncbi:hypothetical protein NF867_14265 [Solitalea sp. MAHUQ-68]|uniref:DUF4034 domain-containing protein n=1 Tax=Solitalea agri TaxID=2953739 RepID=A0A9X2F3J3_9SPHI|nr:hypothetical protein [Solitalea agri]MCO4294027.1 hypothetical protein [Solitalea agri]